MLLPSQHSSAEATPPIPFQALQTGGPGSVNLQASYVEVAYIKDHMNLLWKQLHIHCVDQLYIFIIHRINYIFIVHDYNPGTGAARGS